MVSICGKGKIMPSKESKFTRRRLRKFQQTDNNKPPPNQKGSDDEPKTILKHGGKTVRNTQVIPVTKDFCSYTMM